MGNLRKDFSDWEFWSPDVNIHEMEDKHLNLLQEARTEAGVVFPINSGWRTIPHHNEIYEALGITPAPPSAHPEGWASDIGTGTSFRTYNIVQACLAVGFPRIIIYDTFIHVDNHPERKRFPQPMFKRGRW